MVIKQVKKAYGQIKKVFFERQKEFLWIYDNFYIIDRHYKSIIKSKKQISRIEKTGFFEIITEYCEKNSFAADEKTLCAFLAEKSESRVFTGAELYGASVLASCLAIIRIGDACRGEREAGIIPSAVNLLRNISEIDVEQLFFAAWEPEKILAGREADYDSFSDATKHGYRNALSEYAKNRGISETDAARSLEKQSESGTGTLGSLLFDKKNKKPFIYFFIVFFIFALFAAVCAALCGFPGIFLLPPLYETALSAADYILSFFLKTPPVPRLELEEVPPDAKTLVVITSLLFGEKKDKRLFDNLERYYHLNNGENIYFGILGDLPDSRAENNASDAAAVGYALDRIAGLNEKYGGRFCLYYRNRVYNAADGIYGGYERKRGAVAELAAFICGEKVRDGVYSGGDFIGGIKYLMTLDADTNLSLDSVKELLGVLLHPLNKPELRNGTVVRGHALVQPLMRTELTGAYKTRFTRLISGVGGFDAYGGASFDRYQSVWNSGVFCGKGIFDVRLFHRLVTPKIPRGKILSHDIIEGGILRACFVSDLSLTDGTPKNTVSYTERQHRWMRGDFQNLIFLKSREIGALTKYRLWANARRQLAPVSAALGILLSVFLIKNDGRAVLYLSFAFSYLLFPCLLAVLTILFSGKPFALRRFFSQTSTAVRQTLSRTFYEISASFHMSYCAADAASRSFWRIFFSRKKLLEWVTAGESDETDRDSVFYYIRKCLPSGIAGGLIFIFASASVFKLLGLVFFLFPLIAKAQSKPLGKIRGDTVMMNFSASDKAFLRSEAKDMWGFFADNVNKKSNFLPPDNIQLSPSESAAYRTSPTNIGFYLVSVLAAADMGFITAEEMLPRLEKSFETIKKLEKYKGNLYNWYDLKTLRVIGNKYVSTVDSGNFVTMLVALKQGLTEYAENSGRLAKLINDCSELIENTELSVFYNRRRQLFVIGLDAETGEADNSFYDLFMSEARLTGYYAAAAGKIPKKHWKSLGRTLTAANGYIGMLSWSGTMFEYLMPHLFLPVFRNSFVFESLSFAVNEQKRCQREKMWGTSESGFYSFDSDMNYQYKAHGLQKIALKRYNGDESVLSPYSAYLSLAVCGQSALKNLKLFRENGMYGKYGLYEALDMTPSRSGSASAGVAVRSYMAHHVGMSIISCANACAENIFVRRFMGDKRMGAAYELLQEKIPTDAHIFEDGRSRFPQGSKPLLPKKIKTVEECGLASPSVAFVSKGGLGIIGSGSGHLLLRHGGTLLTDTVFSRYSLRHSLTVQFIDPNGVHGCAPLYRDGVYTFEKGGDYFAHISSSKAFSGRVKYYIHPKCDVFVIETRGESKKDYSLVFSFEPVLDGDRNYYSHPSFSKLFLEAEYDAKEKILYFSRRPRSEDKKKTYLAVALKNAETRFDFSTRKDMFRAWELEDPRSAAAAAPDNLTGACVNPVCTVRTEKIPGGRAALLISFASGKREARNNILRARREYREQERLTVRPPEAERILKSMLFGNSVTRAEKFLGGNINMLWRHGISGDYPLVCLFVSGEAQSAVGSFLSAFLLLTQTDIRTELVFLTEENDRYSRPIEKMIKSECEKAGVGAFINRNAGIFIKNIRETDRETVEFLKLSAVLFIDISNDADAGGRYPAVASAPRTAVSPFPYKKEASADAYDVFGGYFSDSGFTADKSFPLKMPFSYILTGRHFGSVVTDSSLGYTFFDNAREKRVTPFPGDPYSLSDGETLILRSGEENYDLCAAASFVNYRLGVAEYRGEIDGRRYTVTVFISEKFPVKLIRVNCGEFEAPKISFITKPLMGSGVFPSNKLQTVFGDGCAFFKNESSSDFSYAVGFIGCSGGCSVFTDYNLLMTGVESGAEDIIAAQKQGSDCIFYLGACASESGAAFIAENAGVDFYQKELDAARSFARSMGTVIKADCKSRSLNLLYNDFLPYQAAACRFYAKASFYQTGGAFGFRDQLQDCLALVYSDPALVRTHILRCCAHQYPEGDVQHWWHPIYSGRANRGVRTKCTDDFLWLPFVTADYLVKTADYPLLDVEIEYISSPPLNEQGERYELPSSSGLKESVYTHCLRALSNADRFGERGLSLIGTCDWNDAFSHMGVLGRGESVFTSFFYIWTIKSFLPFIIKKGDAETAAHYRETVEKLSENLDKNAYTGEWYARAFHDDGSPVGTAGSGECEIDILPQCLAAIINGGSEKASAALDRAYERLYDAKNKLFRLFTPPFKDGGLNVGYIKGYVAGIRENGGQYTHAAVWAAMGFISAGKNETGLQILSAINPASRCADHEIAKRYKAEPYVICADVYSNPAHSGRGGWSWYTGAAAWYYKAVTEYVFGIRLSENFRLLTLAPIVEYSAEISYNGYKLTIIVSMDTKTPLLDGDPVVFPLEIPSGEHILRAPLEITNL